MTRHLVQIVGVAALLIVGIIYPFLPGAYDSLAMPLSTMAQLLGVLGVLLVVPVGGLWLAYEFREQRRRKRDLPPGAQGYWFAVASLIAAWLVALAVSLLAIVATGISFGLLAVAGGLCLSFRLRPGLQRLRGVASERFNPAPVYLVFIPIAVGLFQFMLAAPATEFSRRRAIANAEAFISDIEAYHARHGRYPSTLSAIWKDYHPSVVGIERFHYAPNGEAYDLFFEQPRFLFDNIGTREFVVYNKLDQHLMISHTAWRLRFTPEELQTRQGWYAVHDGPSPHWRYFWFD